MEQVGDRAFAARECRRDVYCRCSHTAPAGEETRWAGMDFCSERCRDAYIFSVAGPRDYEAYAMDGDYAGLVRFLAENSEVLADLRGCPLPWDSVWAGVCGEFARGSGEFVWWMEAEWEKKGPPWK